MPTQTKSRKWTIDPKVVQTEDGDYVEYMDRDEAAAAFVECETILARLGGAFIIVADREAQPDGSYETKRIFFEWQSYVPARQARENGQPEEVEQEERSGA